MGAGAVGNIAPQYTPESSGTKIKVWGLGGYSTGPLLFQGNSECGRTPHLEHLPQLEQRRAEALIHVPLFPRLILTRHLCVVLL